MANNELFKTIEQLKKTLSDVSSARQQVNDTVNAYEKTSIEIKLYADNLKAIEESVKSLTASLQSCKGTLKNQSSSTVEALKTSCDALVETTGEKLAGATARFSNDASLSIDAMQKQVDKFTDVISEARKLSAKVEATSGEALRRATEVEKMQKELVSSQNAQKDIISQINRVQSNTNAALQSVNTTSSGMVATLTNMVNVLAQHGDALQALIDKSDALIASTKDISGKSDALIAGTKDISDKSDALIASTKDISDKCRDIRTALNSLSNSVAEGNRLTAEVKSSQQDQFRLVRNELKTIKKWGLVLFAILLLATIVCRVV